MQRTESYLPGDEEWGRLMKLDKVSRLDGYVARLNRLRWVADSGFLYFVAKREKPDNEIERFVDRSERKGIHH